MNKKQKIMGGIGLVVLLLSITAYAVLDQYVLNKPTLIMNTMEAHEKYTALSYETLSSVVDPNSSYDSLDIYVLKDGEEVKFETTDSLEESLDLVFRARRKASTTEQTQTLVVEDTIEPTINIQYDGENVSDSLQFEADSFDITKLTVIATDMRNGTSVDLDHDYTAEALEAALQNPGETSLTVSTTDGVFEVSQTVVITIDEALPEEAPQEETEAPNASEQTQRKDRKTPQKRQEKSKTEEKQNKPAPSQSQKETSSGYVDAGLGRAVLDATNRARKEHGLAPVAYDGHIQNLAIERTHTMNRRSGISHDGVPAGYAENLYYYAGNNGLSGDAIVKAFLKSPTHRSILLDPDYTKAGMAVIVVDKFYEKYNMTLPTYYAVQLYAF